MRYVIGIECDNYWFIFFYIGNLGFKLIKMIIFFLKFVEEGIFLYIF